MLNYVTRYYKYNHCTYMILVLCWKHLHIFINKLVEICILWNTKFKDFWDDVYKKQKPAFIFTLFWPLPLLHKLLGFATNLLAFKKDSDVPLAVKNGKNTWRKLTAGETRCTSQKQYTRPSVKFYVSVPQKRCAHFYQRGERANVCVFVHLNGRIL